MKESEKLIPMTYPSNVKVIHYHLTPNEIYALHRLIIYAGWMPRDDSEITDIVNRICQIAKANGMDTGNNKTT
jgi:predicted ATP-grasp superfamily ATP-dependent carboligase